MQILRDLGLAICGFAFLVCFSSTTYAQDARITAVGDSTFAWNGDQGVPAAMAKVLGEPIVNEAVSGAQFAHRFRMLVGPMDIRAQTLRKPWDWVVVTGGANDLAARCDCADCTHVLDELVTPDTMLGAIPDYLELMTARGHKVLWAQYYDAPKGGGPFSACNDAFTVLEERLDRLAARMSGVFMADMSDAIDPKDLSLYSPDRVHPSPAGSAAIGTHLAHVLSALDERAANGQPAHQIKD